LTKKVAVLWDERYIQGNSGYDSPFLNGKLRKAMEYMTKRGRKKGLDIYTAHFSSYKKGRLKEAYFFRKGRWSLTHNVKIDLVFDKFYFTEETKDLKYRISKEISIFNEPEFEELCKDKYRLYQRFPEKIPKTFKADIRKIENIYEKIKTEKVVVKPRFGSAGESVEIIEKKDMVKKLEGLDKKRLEAGDILLQEFKDSSSGIPSLGIKNVHDLRIILVNGKPSYSFLRIPDKGYVSNVSRGGKIKAVNLEEIPEEAIEMVEEVDKVLSCYENRIYSADLIFDADGRPWIIELNSKPGIKFADDQVTETKKCFIDDIVKTLA